MCGGECVHVIDFAVGGQSAMEFCSVIRGNAALDIAFGFVKDPVGFA